MTTDNQEQVQAGNEPVVQTPAAKPAAPAPTAQPAASNEQEVTPYEYPEVPDDPGLNMALKFIGGQGIGVEHPAVQAAIKGDFSFLRAELATRGDKARGYEEYLKLAETSYQKHVDQQVQKDAATEKVVHQAVGGAEKWQEIQSWAKENADESERKEFNAMLNAGGFQARAAATLLQSMHANALGTVQVPADAVKNVPANNSANTGTALSPAAFQKEFSALVAKVGVTAAGRSPEYQQLIQRRNAYRG